MAGNQDGQAGEVSAIIDMDGYNVMGGFRCKELGWKAIGNPKSYSFFFYHGEMRDLLPKDRCTIQYVERNIFDIPYNAYWPGMIRGEALEKVVRGLYTGGVVAYKGGHFEKDLLARLRIPSFNLEDLGCPKINDIKYPFDIDLTCGHHHIDYVHCPKGEVLLFDYWFSEYCWNHGIIMNKSDIQNPFPSLNGNDFAFV